MYGGKLHPIDVETSVTNNMNQIPKEKMVEVFKFMEKEFKKRLTAAQALMVARSVASKLQTVLQIMLPCKKGCSRCCKQAVAVLPIEAKIIANTYKLKLHPATKDTVMTRDEYVTKFTGKDCPFLKDNICSIYQERPMACRIKWNVSSYPELCDTIENPKAAKSNIDLRRLDMLLITSMFSKAEIAAKKSIAADIREWFPDNVKE